MKNLLTFLTTAVFCLGIASPGWAEDKQVPKAPDVNRVESKADVAARAELLAKMHRTIADLIEARVAERPDQAKIDKLTAALRQLRGKLVAQAVTVADDQLVGVCPWGGPGPRFGRGAGWRRGAGFGYGGGSGPGRGFGPGAGRGLAPGGPAFVDRNNNGICDNYELRYAPPK